MPIYRPFITLFRRLLPGILEEGEAVVPRIKMGRPIPSAKPTTPPPPVAELPPVKQLIKPPQVQPSEVPEELVTRPQQAAPGKEWHSYLEEQNFIPAEILPEEGLVYRHLEFPEAKLTIKMGEPVNDKAFLDSKIAEALKDFYAVEPLPQLGAPLPELPKRLTPPSAARPLREMSMEELSQIPPMAELQQSSIKEIQKSLRQLAQASPEVISKYKEVYKKVPPEYFLRRELRRLGLLEEGPATKTAVKQALGELDPKIREQLGKMAGRASRTFAFQKTRDWNEQVIMPLKQLVDEYAREAPPRGMLPGFFSRILPARMVMEAHPVTAGIFRTVSDINSWAHSRLVQEKTTIRKVLDRLKVDPKKDLEVFTHYMNNRTVLTPEQLAAIPKHIQMAGDRIAASLARIGKDAKLGDPAIGFIKDYWPRTWVVARRNLENELAALNSQLEDAHLMQMLDPRARSALTERAKEIQEKIKRLTETGTKLDAVRGQALAKGGYYGHLSESRTLKQLMPDLNFYIPKYNNILHVMDDYIEGAYRKAFLDRALPVMRQGAHFLSIAGGKGTPSGADLTSLRNYFLEWANGIRGVSSFAEKSYIAQGISNLSGGKLSPYEARRAFEIGVEAVMAMQYLLKIGISWIRFPIVNLSQNTLTFALAGPKAYFAGLKDALKALARDNWAEARHAGVLVEDFRPLAEANLEGLAKLGSRVGDVIHYAKKLGFLPQMSENFNRAVAYHVGKRVAEMNPTLAKQLAPTANFGTRKGIYQVAREMVSRTQWEYTPIQMPIITRSPMGRLLWQFRSYSSFYIQYLNDLRKMGRYKELATALGMQAALVGTGLLPFNLWERIREHAMRHWGVDLPELRPIKAASEAFLPGRPLTLEQSFEPWNPPGTVEQLLGPTIGPMVGGMFAMSGSEEQRKKFLEKLPERISPPVARFLKGTLDPEARTEPSKLYPEGRPLGKRPLMEKLHLGASTEQIYNEIQNRMKDVQIALRKKAISPERAAKKMQELREKARKAGITPTMIAQMAKDAKARASVLYYREIGKERAKLLKERISPPVFSP